MDIVRKKKSWDRWQSSEMGMRTESERKETLWVLYSCKFVIRAKGYWSDLDCKSSYSELRVRVTVSLQLGVRHQYKRALYSSTPSILVSAWHLHFLLTQKTLFLSLRSLSVCPTTYQPIVNLSDLSATLNELCIQDPRRFSCSLLSAMVYARSFREPRTKPSHSAKTRLTRITEAYSR